MINHLTSNASFITGCVHGASSYTSLFSMSVIKFIPRLILWSTYRVSLPAFGANPV